MAEETINELDKSSLTDQDFREWLRGFIDAEGCFYIEPTRLSEYSFQFKMRIKLHCDDRPLLCYIRDRLNIGSIHPLNIDLVAQKNWVTWTVIRREDVEKLFTILAPLNPSKNFDYQNFKKAFNLVKEIKNSTISEKNAIKDQVLYLKSIMNTKKTVTVASSLLDNMNQTHAASSFYKEKGTNIKITPYYLLGFIEGEGCFTFSRYAFSTFFQIEQTISEKPVIEAIAEYLKSIIPDNLVELKDSKKLINIVDRKARGRTVNEKPSVTLTFSNMKYLTQVFIPFLDSLIFLSKKNLDYRDWKKIVSIKVSKKHLTPEGKELILHLGDKMNKNRLSTNLNSLNTQTLSDKEINIRLNNLLLVR